MSEENKTLIEQVESSTPSSNEETDSLKEAVTEQLTKIKTQSLLLGAQTSCSVILQKIIAWEKKPGKRTLNDYRRLVKDIKSFCEVGLSKQVNPDGTTSPKEENDIEDNNTKLTEEAND